MCIFSYLFISYVMSKATINLSILFRKSYNFYEQTPIIFYGIACTLHTRIYPKKDKNIARSHCRDQTYKKIRHTSSHQEVYEHQMWHWLTMFPRSMHQGWRQMCHYQMPTGLQMQKWIMHQAAPLAQEDAVYTIELQISEKAMHWRAADYMQ